MDEEKDGVNQDGSTNEKTKDENIEDLKIKKAEDNQGNISEENQENIEELREEVKKDNKKLKIGIGICCILIIFSMIVGTTVSKYKDIVYPGVSTYGENMAKLSKDEVDKKLTEIVNNIEQEKIYVNANNKKYEIKIKELVSNCYKEDLSDEIINYSKNENVFKKFGNIIMKKEEKFKFKMGINEVALEKFVDQIKKETNIACKEPEVIINGDSIQYKEGKKGNKLDEKALINDIKKAINKNDILENKIKISAIYKDDNPKIKYEDLKKVDTKVSSYATSYGSGNSRGRNVENAASKIDNLLLMPGEEFSYEKAVGPVTADNGYGYAPVISNGELQQGIGGGVCQVSSTLYNTQLKAGILPTERRNHSKAVSYVPRGLDATLASGSIDYKFKNTYDYPLVINTHTNGGVLTIEFWSNKNALEGIEYKPVSYGSGKIANTYLYGYDKYGKKVYEKHIDTSIYK